MIYGIPVCWGCDPLFASLPIVNIPEDAISVRRRIRSDRVAMAYVRRSSGIVEEYRIAPNGSGMSLANGLKLLGPFGVNRNEKQKPR